MPNKPGFLVIGVLSLFVGCSSGNAISIEMSNAEGLANGDLVLVAGYPSDVSQRLRCEAGTPSSTP